MMPLLVPIAISLLIGSYATADGLCGKPCWAVLRNANSSFCSFCRSAEGCWPFPRINFNIVARWCYFWSSVVRLALFWVFFLSVFFFSLSLSHAHSTTQNSTLIFRFSSMLVITLLLNCARSSLRLRWIDAAWWSKIYLFLYYLSVSFSRFAAREAHCLTISGLPEGC